MSWQGQKILSQRKILLTSFSFSPVGTFSALATKEFKKKSSKTLHPTVYIYVYTVGMHVCAPQGSVLGPILFLVYTHSLAILLAPHKVDGHFYARDWQIYLPIANIHKIKTKVLAILSDIRT